VPSQAPSPTIPLLPATPRTAKACLQSRRCHPTWRMPCSSCGLNRTVVSGCLADPPLLGDLQQAALQRPPAALRLAGAQPASHHQQRHQISSHQQLLASAGVWRTLQRQPHLPLQHRRQDPAGPALHLRACLPRLPMLQGCPWGNSGVGGCQARALYPSHPASLGHHMGAHLLGIKGQLCASRVWAWSPALGHLPLPLLRLAQHLGGLRCAHHGPTMLQLAQPLLSACRPGASTPDCGCDHGTNGQSGACIATLHTPIDSSLYAVPCHPQPTKAQVRLCC
jgi:hypothetical protein